MCQRRVAQYLLNETTQCFVTSHSPYVIEHFGPEQILVLRRDAAATVTGTLVSLASSLKPKMYRKHARRGLAEGMLGAGVIVAEGVTEQAALSAVAEKMEAADASLYPLDLSGVTVFPVEGDGSMPMFGAFFKTLGLKAYAFYDRKQRTPKEQQQFIDSFDLPYEAPYLGIEQLLVAEVQLDRQWEFLDDLRQAGVHGHIGIPAARPGDEQVKALMMQALKSNKGNSYAARLIERCGVAELPASITSFLAKVYADFPRPAPVPYAKAAADKPAEAQPQASAADGQQQPGDQP